jgi:hypothetical protein
MLTLNKKDEYYLEAVKRRFPKNIESIDKNLKFFNDKINQIVEAFLNIPEDSRVKVVQILFNNYNNTVSYSPDPIVKLSFLDAIKLSFLTYIDNINKYKKSHLLSNSHLTYDIIKLINNYNYGFINYNLQSILETNIYSTNLWKFYLEQLANTEDTFNRLMLKNILILLSTDLELYEKYVDKGYFDRTEVYKF